jgi:predicted N-acyltransferase
VNSEIKVKIFRSVNELGKDTINSISDDPFFTYEWFRTIETQQAVLASPIYLAVYNESKVVGVVPLFIHLVDPNPKDLSSKLLNLGHRIGFWQNRVLSCYSPCSARSKILLAHDQDAKIVLDIVSKKIDAICREQKILVSGFPFVSEFDTILFENLKNCGYRKRAGITTLYIDVQWLSFEDYLRSLTHKTREHVRREIRKCKESGVTIEEEELDDLAPKVSELFTNISSKYKNTVKIFVPYFFSMLDKYAKEKKKLFIAKKNGEVIGFSLSLRHKDVLDVLMVGFDYGLRTNTDFSYFNLCFYAPINYAIESGVKKIYYRYTMEKIKIDRGCKPEKTYNFIKYHNKLLSILTGFAAKCSR